MADPTRTRSLDCNCHVPAGNAKPCPVHAPGIIGQVPVVYACGHVKHYDPPEDEFDAALLDAAAALNCPDCLRLAAQIIEAADQAQAWLDMVPKACVDCGQRLSAADTRRGCGKCESCCDADGGCEA